MNENIVFKSMVVFFLPKYVRMQEEIDFHIWKDKAGHSGRWFDVRSAVTLHIPPLFCSVMLHIAWCFAAVSHGLAVLTVTGKRAIKCQWLIFCNVLLFVLSTLMGRPTHGMSVPGVASRQPYWPRFLHSNLACRPWGPTTDWGKKLSSCLFVSQAVG